MEEIKCLICLNKIDNNQEISLRCEHKYHSACLSNLDEAECPECLVRFDRNILNLIKMSLCNSLVK
jgi:hypothetical protein